jgi:adenylate cyclase
MDRIWQWAWDRYGPRYSWALFAMSIPSLLLIYVLWGFLIVAIEGSTDYLKAAVVMVIGVPVVSYAIGLPGVGPRRIVESWAAGHDIDRATALDATYAWTRGAIVRTVVFHAVWASVSGVAVGAIAGATCSHVVQFGIVGAAAGTGVGLTAAHNLGEAAMRPVRADLADDTGIGDSLPRSRPTFAAWSSAFMLAVAFVFAVVGAMSVAALDRYVAGPVLYVAIGGR